MKQRFSYLDLQIIANELNQVCNYRLQNIYDLSTSSRQFLLKFSVPDSKKLVVVDPGFRIHLTDFNRPTAQFPSGFVTKLRKHLKSRRLNQVRLAPLNRMLVLSFNDDNSSHLVFEFFAGGNMILLDNEFRILTLQRVVSANENQSRCAVGEVYPLDDYLNASDNTAEINEQNVKSWLTSKNDNNDEDNDNKENDVNPLQRSTDRRVRKQNNKPLALKKLLYQKAPGIATGLIENSLRQHDINPGAKVDAIIENLDSVIPIVNALQDAKIKSQQLVENHPVPGYILAKKNPRFDPSKEKASVKEDGDVNSIDPHNIEYLYEEFQPFQPQIPETEEGWKLIETETFNKAADVYFSTLEATKLSMRAANQELVADKRLKAAKAEQDKRIQGLNEVQERGEKLGNALLDNADLVEEACEAVRKLIKQGMDWLDIEKLITVEKTRDNPVADIISLPLNLKKNKITVLLHEPTNKQINKNNNNDSDSSSDSSDSSDDESEQQLKPRAQRVKVEVDLGLTAWANAGTYFDVKKTAAAKQERTLQTAGVAYKNAEKKIRRDLKEALAKEKNQQTMQAVREPFWFEKFFWFMSSDGYLVLSGRDNMQNELLFRRQFKKYDILVGCDVEGSSIGIIKNHFQTDDVPPSTLTQAGAFVASTSQKVWDSKMSTPTWWARHDQVPKVSKQGEMITTDRLVVDKEGKNWLPPTSQDMGYGFLWVISEESKHLYSNPHVTGMDKSVEQVAEEEVEQHEEEESEDEEFPDTQIPDDDEEKEDEETPEPEPRDIEPQTTENENDSPEPQQEIQTDIAEDSKDKNELQNSGESTDTCTPREGGKKLSAKERRQLRKQRAADANNSNNNNNKEDEEPMNEIERELAKLKTEKKAAESVKSNNSEQKAPMTKSQKAKAKKRAKYAHQDEEDRERAMELLGARKGEEKARKAEEDKKKKEEHERIKKEKLAKQKQRELEKLKAAEQEDDTPQDDRYAFEALVPRLASGDNKPLAVVPAFGPWQSMQRFKYKVKIQPGPMKKGKATKDMVRVLSNARTDNDCKHSDMPWPIELEMIKNIRDTDLLLPMTVGKVKLMMPGAKDANKSNNSKGGGKKRGKK